MARPQSISSEQILDAARRLFLEQGHRCATAAIAREAGVSEGTIFKRFGTKENLFRAAMGLPEFKFLEELPGLVGQATLRQNMETLASEIMAFFRVMIPLVMRLRSHPCFDPIKFLSENEDAAPHKMLKGVTNYFHAEIGLGRLRPCDPEVLARMLLGSVHNYVFFEAIGVHSRMPIAPQSYVRALIDMVWSGIAPTPPSSPS